MAGFRMGLRSGRRRNIAGFTTLVLAGLLAGCSNGSPAASGERFLTGATVKPAGIGASKPAMQLQPLWSTKAWLAWPGSNSSGTVSLGSESWVAHLTSPQPRGIASPPGLLVGHDVRSGEESWSVTLPTGSRICALAPSHVGSPVVGVVLGGPRGCVTAAGISADTGKTVWSRTVRSEASDVRTSAGAIAVGDQGTLGHQGAPYSCFAPIDGSPLPATSPACVSASAVPRLIRADGTVVLPNDFRELATYDGVTIGWLTTESESQLFAFSATSGQQLWQRARAKAATTSALETVFADGRGLIRVVGDGAQLKLTRVDAKTMGTLSAVGTVKAEAFLGLAGDVAIFFTAGVNVGNHLLSGYRLP